MVSSRPWSTIVLFVAISLAACNGDDDGPTDPGGGGGDTTAPVVLSSDPRDGDIGVEVGASITVTFNEDMDTESDDGAIALSHGNTGVTGTWTDDRTLVIGHADFPEATEVTVTLGTGFADAAGNTLASAHSFSFFTESSTLVLLGSDPDDGATGIDRNAVIALQFSESMNLSTLAGFITVDDGRLARLPVAFSLSEGENDEVLIDPTETLPELSTITVTVQQGAQSQGGATLAAAETISFDTGSTADTTPPTLVGTTPSTGSVISPNTSTLVLEFSEAIDGETLRPDVFSGQFALLLESFDLEPTWSGDGTTLTVPLPTPLPAGLPILVRFPPFSDRAGNESTSGFEFRVTVEGAADPMPFVDGVVLFYEGFSTRTQPGVGTETNEYEDAVRFEEQGDGDFRLATYDPSFLEVYGYDLYERTASQVLFKGWAEADEGVLEDLVDISPPVPFLQLPLTAGATWSGTATAMQGGESMSIDYEFEVVGKSDLPFGGESGGGGPSETLIWVDAWAIVLEYEFRDGATVVSTGTDSTYYAPSVGRVRNVSFEQDLDDGSTESSVEILVGIDLGLE